MDQSAGVCVLLLLITVVIGVLYQRLVTAHKYWKKLGVPHSKPELLFGNIRRVLFLKESFPTMLHNIYEDMTGYRFGGFYILTFPCIIVRDPRLINHVLVGDCTNFSHRIEYQTSKGDPMSYNICLMKGDLWKEVRQRMSQAFSVSHTRRVFFLVQECCARLQTSVQTALKNQPSRDAELKNLLATFTTDVIGMCAFGIECGAIDQADSPFRRIGPMIYETSTVDALRKLLTFFMPKIAAFLGVKFYSSSVEEFFDRIVMETIQYRRKNGIFRDDLINIMMKLKDEDLKIEDKGEKIEITDKLLVAQMLMAFTLGFEMTSSTMSFCLHELSLNPDVQTKARMEVDAVLRNHGGELTYEAIQEMTYLDMVVAETIRLYPPVGHLFRHSNKAFKFPGSDITFPEGTMVYVPVLSLHRDPQYFAHPLRFNPERFRRGNKDPSCFRADAYLPFGEGLRSCVGQKFAMVEMKAGLATLLSHFEFSRCPRSSGSPAPFETRKAIGTPAGGLWARLAPRIWLPVR